MIARENGGKIISVAPFFLVNSLFFGKKIVSLPFSDSGGFCLKAGLDQETQETALCLFFAELGRTVKKTGSRFVEIRGWNGAYDRGMPPVNKKQIFPFVNFALDLKPGYHAIYEGYRRNIKRDLHRGAAIKIRKCVDIKEAREVFEIYCREIRKFGSPPLPWRYFLSEWEILRSQNAFSIFVAEHDARIVGGILLLHYGSNVHAEHITSMPEYSSFHVKQRLYDHSLRWAAEQGFLTYNFCRARKNTGVYHHKKGWGAKEEEIGYLFSFFKRPRGLYIDYDQKNLGPCKWALRRLPVKFSKFVGYWARRELAQ
jgi:hypothetical protein